MPKFSPQVLALLAASTFVFPFAAHAAQADDDETAVPETTLKALLSSSEVPLSIQMKVMDASWRRFTINGNSMTALQWQMMGAAGGIEIGVHFTKGQTVILGGETYLIAYRLPIVIDPRFLNWHGHGDPPRPRKPSDLTSLPLSLLNLRTTGSLNDLRPFNAGRDMVNTEQANAASVKTLTQLGQGVMRYIKARGVLPYLNNPIPWDAGRVFYPYVGDERLYMHPATQEMYRYNEILGGKKIKHLTDLKNFAVFYEASDSGDNTRGVLFLDGHVERAAPARWAQIKKASKIKNDGDGTANNAGDDEVAAAPVATTTVVVNVPPPGRVGSVPAPRAPAANVTVVQNSGY
jgi:prepilin-type processing-associated H-X9-DG protein